MKQDKIVKELVKKYKTQKNVVGIYIFGSLARSNSTPKSDVDIEIIFRRGKKPYELKKKIIDGIPVDLSLYDQKQFIKDFSKYYYLHYAALDYKIFYDPEGLLKKYLGEVKRYFKENPKITKFLMAQRTFGSLCCETSRMLKSCILDGCQEHEFMSVLEAKIKPSLSTL